MVSSAIRWSVATGHPLRGLTTRRRNSLRRPAPPRPAPPRPAQSRPGPPRPRPPAWPTPPAPAGLADPTRARRPLLPGRARSFVGDGGAEPGDPPRQLPHRVALGSGGHPIRRGMTGGPALLSRGWPLPQSGGQFRNQVVSSAIRWSVATGHPMRGVTTHGRNPSRAPRPAAPAGPAHPTRARSFVGDGGAEPGDPPRQLPHRVLRRRADIRPARGNGSPGVPVRRGWSLPPCGGQWQLTTQCPR